MTDKVWRQLRGLAVTIGLLLMAVLLLAWVVSQVSLGETWVVLQRLNAGQVLGLVCLNVVILLGFALRWWLMLRAQGQMVGFGAALAYRVMAYAVSYFTPGPHFGGEPLQVATVVRRHNVPISAAVAAVALDKTLEMLANFGFLLVGVMVLLGQVPLTGPQQGGLVLAVVGLMALPGGYLLGLQQGHHPLSRLLKRLPLGRFSWGSKLLLGLAESERLAGHACQTQPRLMGLAAVVSLVTWGLMLAEYWLLITFLGAGANGWQVVAALTAARVAILLPMPGGLGALEASQVLAWGALGAGGALGLSASLIIRARDVIVGLLGLALLLIYYLPLRQRA